MTGYLYWVLVYAVTGALLWALFMLAFARLLPGVIAAECKKDRAIADQVEDLGLDVHQALVIVMMLVVFLGIWPLMLLLGVRGFVRGFKRSWRKYREEAAERRRLEADIVRVLEDLATKTERLEADIVRRALGLALEARAAQKAAEAAAETAPEDTKDSKDGQPL